MIVKGKWLTKNIKGEHCCVFTGNAMTATTTHATLVPRRTMFHQWRGREDVTRKER